MKKLLEVSVAAMLLIIAGYVLVVYISRDTPDSTDEYFFEIVEDYPWVRYAFRQNSESELSYYNQITYLYSLDGRIGFSLLNARWITDYISEEEAQALALLVDVSERDTEIGLGVSQALWFQNGISSIDITIMEYILTMAEENVQIARNVTSANWFFLVKEYKVEEAVRTIKDMPPDLASAVSGASWFTSDFTLAEFKAVQELITFYEQDKDAALWLSRAYQSRDFEALQQVTTLYAEDKELADTFLQYNALTRESFLALSNLSRIVVHDRALAQSLVSELSQDKIQILASLADIYDLDPALGEFASENFVANRVALRYVQKVSIVEHIEPELLYQGALFVMTNPEFIYEDRVEPYRYHLLTQLISEFPLETAQSYKNLIHAACSMYGSRFYSWQTSEYGILEGWASDRQLLDLERDAVVNLLRFLIEKNEEGVLVTDLRMESLEYLHGVLDIPFTHPVNLDGTTEDYGVADISLLCQPDQEMPEEDIVPVERGTLFLKAIIYNINTLEERFSLVQEKLQQRDQVKYTYTNPLVELILEEGEEQDQIFLYFCAKNWELGNCVVHTMHTRMDSIVMGIPTTTMHWTAPETAHIYPAYLPSSAILEEIQSDPGKYGNPFMHRGFIAPYDEAGFRDYLDRDIEVVKIYDLQGEGYVGLFDKVRGRLVHDEKILAVILVGIVLLLLVMVDTFRMIK